MYRTVLLLLSLSLPLIGAKAATINVPADQPTIQAGINAAVAGDTVVVACGTYGESMIGLKDGVCVTSETGEPGCVLFESPFQPVFNLDHIDNSASIIGFSFARGVAQEGVIHLESSHPQIIRCRFVSNFSERGAGLFCAASSPHVVDCVFDGNTAWFDGGAVYSYGSSPSFDACSFLGNSANDMGGGASFIESNTTMTNCLFRGNEAPLGGAVYFDGTPSLYGRSYFTNCSFVINTAPVGSGIFYEAYLEAGISNCLFALNLSGQALEFEDYSPGWHTIEIACSDIYGNPGGDWEGHIASYLGIDGNIAVDPLFCDPSAWNFTIDAVSPCAPANNECGVLIGALGIGCDTSTSVPGDGEILDCSWGTLKVIY